MHELCEHDLEMITGGEDDGGEGTGGGGGGVLTWACGWAPADDGGWEMMCIGPYGDDVLNNAGRCVDDGSPCFI